MTSLLWLRRDLRLGDHPAWLKAVEEGQGETAAVFVIDPRMWSAAGARRRAWLAANIAALNDSIDGRLTLAHGDPTIVIPDLASRLGVSSVHVTRETTPVGQRRDERTAHALAETGVAWVATGTPYAVGPGLVRNRQGGAYQVFTPFSRAWAEHSWPTPAPPAPRLSPAVLPAGDVPGHSQAADALNVALAEIEAAILPRPGEAAALARWDEFRVNGLSTYHTERDRPGVDGTSRLSPYLKVGAIHPRTLLADLVGRTGPGVESFVSELAWREFAADVLLHCPHSSHDDLRDTLSRMRYDEPSDAIEAWRAGHTGYPIVDAGMRQLAATGWMHNRVRMITASFLVKDLHVWWPIGARYFMEQLIDGDVASNSHGWQWTAGTGTDPSPFARVFNPMLQGRRFDPDGDYVRRWVPELAHLPGGAVHEPWSVAAGYVYGYPRRIVDHAQERQEALARFAAVRPSRPSTTRRTP